MQLFLNLSETVERKMRGLTRRLRWLRGVGWSASEFDHHYKHKRGLDSWNYESSPAELRRRDRIVSALPAKYFHRALEVGCAEGFITKILARHVDHLIACDISAEAVSRARINCTGAQNVQFEVVDIRHGFPGDSLDLCLFADVLCYLSAREIDIVLREASRVIKPGGYLMFSNEWHERYDSFLRRWHTSPNYVYRMLDSTDDWVKLKSEFYPNANDVRSLSIAVYQRTAGVNSAC